MANNHCAREAETITAAWGGDGPGPLTAAMGRNRRAGETINAARDEDTCGGSPQVGASAEAGASTHPTLNAELAAHIAGCEHCAAIVALAGALREDRQAACGAAHPPSAGLVWWRAHRRAREEAARRAARPISFVHGIALGCAAAAAVAIVGLVLGDVRTYLSEWVATFSWPALPTATAVHVISSLPLGAALVLAASLLLAPVAIYLALSEE